MADHDTWTKANQIKTLASFGAMFAFDDTGKDILPGSLSAYFEVIQRLAEEISDEIEEMEHKHKIGPIYGKI